jgi:hypothetical protein
MRFTIGALQQVMQRRSYRARIAFLPKEAIGKAMEAASKGGPREKGQHGGHADASASKSNVLVSRQCPAGPSTPLIDALGDASRIDPCDAGSLGQVGSLTRRLSLITALSQRTAGGLSPSTGDGLP